MDSFDPNKSPLIFLKEMWCKKYSDLLFKNGIMKM